MSNMYNMSNRANYQTATFSNPSGRAFWLCWGKYFATCSTLDGNQDAVAFVDYLTKCPEVFATPDKTAEATSLLQRSSAVMVCLW